MPNDEDSDDDDDHGNNSDNCRCKIFKKKKHLLKFCDHLGSLYAVMRYAIGKRFSCSETFPDDHKLPWSIVNYRDHADDYDHDVHDRNHFEVDHDVNDRNNYALDHDAGDRDQFEYDHAVNDDIDHHVADHDVNDGDQHLAKESQC